MTLGKSLDFLEPHGLTKWHRVKRITWDHVQPPVQTSQMESPPCLPESCHFLRHHVTRHSTWPHLITSEPKGHRFLHKRQRSGSSSSLKCNQDLKCRTMRWPQTLLEGIGSGLPGGRMVWATSRGQGDSSGGPEVCQSLPLEIPKGVFPPLSWGSQKFPHFLSSQEQLI